MIHSDLKNAYLERGIWELWHESTFDDFDGDKYKKIVKQLCAEETKQNVVLHGNNGNGKTMLMNIAMKELFAMKNEVYVIDFRHLIKEYVRSWRDDESKIARLLTVDYLAIDDLGKEFKKDTGVSLELAIATLDYVLRYRIQRQKSTWVTFNLQLGDIKKTYNEHIASLFKRNTTTIAFTESDYGDKLLTKYR